jgi:glycosyltransferase involved in cell wall biosynthesis
MELITVITVVKNDPSGLTDTINSVSSQSYRNIEHIVIDGNSSDGTLDVIKVHSTSINLWISEPDGGIYDAMNKGIRLANGIWVNFLNSGDTFFENSTLEKLFAVSMNKDIDVIYGDFALKDIALTNPITIKARSLDSIYTGNVYSHQSCFVRKTTLVNYPFNTNYKIAADYDQMISFHKNSLVFQYFEFPIAIMLSNGRSYNNPRTYIEQMKIVFSNTGSLIKLSYFLPYLGLCLLRMVLGKFVSRILRKFKLRMLERREMLISE